MVEKIGGGNVYVLLFVHVLAYQHFVVYQHFMDRLAMHPSVDICDVDYSHIAVVLAMEKYQLIRSPEVCAWQVFERILRHTVQILIYTTHLWHLYIDVSVNTSTQKLRPCQRQ